ncbi:haloalkane dehalogenase [Streptomyces sp. NPDC047028]|uniref:haloalkane dehalogenase n=1 Tax=Streptomyces sp. NPDC047028 TaxID=3155793 RepID=UPI003406A40E
MRLLRTPDECFKELPGWPFSPRYLQVPIAPGSPETARVHYVDEGPPSAPPVLLMHGEPTWSYLYRHVIPPLTLAGHRVVAVDLVGFGRSDKPALQADYTYAAHVAWMAHAVFGVLDLRDITLVCHDWGGLIGLRLVSMAPDRFAGVVAANTGLPTGAQAPTEGFLAWRRMASQAETFQAGSIVAMGTVAHLPDAVRAAYDAPFPDDTYKAGARVFPALVPLSPEDPAAADQRRAWDVLAGFDKPFLAAFSDRDPITQGGQYPFLARIPAAREHIVKGAGHFLQEDTGPQLAEVIKQFIETKPTRRTTR